MDSRIFYIILTINVPVHFCSIKTTKYCPSSMLCDIALCREGGIRHVVHNRPLCSCPEGLLGSPPNCRLECDTSSDCPENKACISNKCKDPCVGHTCGQHAVCEVLAHIPVCTCPLGRSGDPTVKCNLNCRSNSTFMINGNYSIRCKCESENTGSPFFGCNQPCRTNEDCPLDRACVHNACMIPCPGDCGQNTKCSVINHTPTCICLPGYNGNPLIGCSPIFAKHNSVTILRYSDSKDVQFNCKEYLISPNSSQVGLINVTQTNNKITTFTAFLNKRFSKADNGTKLCCLVYVRKTHEDGYTDIMTHSVEKITLLLNIDEIDTHFTLHTVIYAVSASLGIIIIILIIIILIIKWFRNSSDKQEIPQLSIDKDPNDVFYLNLLFQRECQREIEQQEHHYEEIT